MAWRWDASPQVSTPAAAGLGVSPSFTMTAGTRGEPTAAPEPASSRPRADSRTPTWLIDDLGIAQDLKRFFDAHIGSADPRLHRAAVRALAVCAPAFLPSPGETPSPDSLIAALPQELRIEREAAYRAIYARCASFLGIGRDKLNALQRELLGGTASREAGARAQDDLAAGNEDVANRRIAQALASGDPATVASLAGVAEAWARRSSAAPAEPTRLAAARALDAALPWVACDLGLACGNDSLSALQACATQGQCAGELPMRLSGVPPSDSAESAAVQAQRRRLRGLLKEQRGLTMAELLP